MSLLRVPRSPLLLSSILFAERVDPLTTSLSRLPLVWRKCLDLRLAKLCGRECKEPDRLCRGQQSKCTSKGEDSGTIIEGNIIKDRDEGS